MTAPTSERWRSRWPTQDAARRYLSTIQEAGRRQELADFLGVPLKTSPVQSAFPVQEKRAEWTSTETPAISSPPGSITLYLRWGPSINHYWRHVLIPCRPVKPGAAPYRVQVMISVEGREYRREVLQRIEALRTWGSVVAPPGSRLAVTLTLHGPNRRSFDIDNRIKAVLDALTHAAVWADDSLIDQITVRRGEIFKGGQIKVTITPLDATLFEVQP